MNHNLQLGFRVGGFDVDPLAGEIEGPTGVRHVQPKVMEVLVCLAAHSGEMVSRDTLLKDVWGRPTSEEVLTRCISELRAALDDNRGRPEFIQTVPKRGYRLVKPITAVTMPADRNLERDGRISDPPPSVAALASVAVLPFENHSPHEYGYLADAFASELHRTLASVDRLRVASRRSSFALNGSTLDAREIGRQLDVHYLLSGSLQYDGAVLRIIAELDDAEAGSQVWAKSYDRSSEDILTVQTEIAESVVASFTTQQQLEEMHWAHNTSTANLDAWGLVQKARSLMLRYTSETLAQAIGPLRRAIELDPSYAAAHATLGAVLVERLINGLSDDPPGEHAAALDAAEKAIRIAPRDPFILKMLGVVWAYAGEHGRSIACLRRAAEYAPFDCGTWGYMGWPLTASGESADLEELHRILDRILTMEPRHHGVPFWLYHRSVACVSGGELSAAANAIEKALELQPGFGLGWMHYASVLGALGKKPDAGKALDRCRAINPAMTPDHFVTLVRQLSSSKSVVEARTSGLLRLS